MPRKPTPFSLKFVQHLRNTIRDGDRLDHLALTHRIPIVPPGGGASLVFTVDIVPGREERYLATCREMPRFYASGPDEEIVLVKAELEIRLRLREQEL